MTGQHANFKKWQHLLRQAYDIDAGQTRCPDFYDILNSPKVEQILKRDKKDYPPLMVGNVDQAVLDKRWGIAYHKIMGSSYWQNHAEVTFAGEIQTALNKVKETLTDSARTPTSETQPEETSSDGVELIRQGVRLIEAGDYRAAIDRLDRAIQLQPNSSEAFASRAWAWYKLAAIPKARNDCDEAIRLDPDFAWVYVIRGRIFNLSNQLEAAIKNLNTAIRKLNQEIDRVKQQIKEADRNGELSIFVELKDGKLADLKRKLREAEAELAKIQASQETSSSEPLPEPPEDKSTDCHLKVQVSERQLQQQETIEVRVPITGTNVSFQLKPEMRNKKVRFSGFLKQGGELFVEVCIAPESEPEPVLPPPHKLDFLSAQIQWLKYYLRTKPVTSSLLAALLVMFLSVMCNQFNRFVNKTIDCSQKPGKDEVIKLALKRWGNEYPDNIDQNGNFKGKATEAGHQRFSEILGDVKDKFCIAN